MTTSGGKYRRAARSLINDYVNDVGRFGVAACAPKDTRVRVYRREIYGRDTSVSRRRFRPDQYEAKARPPPPPHTRGPGVVVPRAATPPRQRIDRSSGLSPDPIDNARKERKKEREKGSRARISHARDRPIDRSVAGVHLHGESINRQRRRRRPLDGVEELNRSVDEGLVCARALPGGSVTFVIATHRAVVHTATVVCGDM